MTEDRASRRDREQRELKHVLVLCHNPVVDRDTEACGEAGTAPASATSATTSSTSSTTPQTPSPWGIMIDSDDPMTGEKIADEHQRVDAT